MRKFFGVLYALFGCGLAALLTKGVGMTFAVVLGALAMLFFFAAWQALPRVAGHGGSSIRALDR